MVCRPNTRAFPALANLSQQVRARYPGALRFINLLPNFAGPQYYGPIGEFGPNCSYYNFSFSCYTNYVDQFVREMTAASGPEGIDILSMDHCAHAIAHAHD